MKAPQAPRLDERRAAQFAAELQERARAWIPAWGLADAEQDFGRALLEIAARFDSEVAERLDGSGEKMRRGFLDWLAVRGQAARPARMPVVFKLTDAAREAVRAEAPVRLQADAAGAAVVFETERDVRVVPGQLDMVVGVDADQDAFYLPPPGLNDLKPLESLPTEWRVKSFAAAGSTKLQLDPELGLVVGMLIEANGAQYSVLEIDNGLVTIDRPLESELTSEVRITKVSTFTPFEGTAFNSQQHSLYLGDLELLNVEAAATIEVVGASDLREGYAWQYWGKVESQDEVKWQPFKIDEERQKIVKDAIVLTKPKGAIEELEIGGKKSRWIRAYLKTVDATANAFRNDALSIRINSSGCGSNATPCPPEAEIAAPLAEAMANTTPLVIDNVFFPLGKEPRQFDAFYLGSQEAFSKKGAKAQLCLEMADPTFAVISIVRGGRFTNTVIAGVGKDRALHLLTFDPATGEIRKFREREPLQPPLPGFEGNAQPGNAVAFDQPASWRLPVWFEADDSFLVAATAGDAIWVWHEKAADIDLNKSGWISFGSLPPSVLPAPTPVDGLVYLSSLIPKLCALRAGEFFIRDWPTGAQWLPVNTKQGLTTIKLRSIVPVFIVNAQGRLVTSEFAGMIGVSNAKKLFKVTSVGTCTPRLAAFDFDAEVRPVAVDRAGDITVAAVTDANPPEIVAFDEATATTKKMTLDTDMKVLGALEAAVVGGNVHILAAVADGGSGRLITWAPFAPGAESAKLESSVAASGGRVGGAPTALDKHVVIPGARADILVSEFDPTLRLIESANVEIGVVVPDSVPALASGDLFVRFDTEPEARLITHAGLTKDGEVFYRIASDFPAGATPPITAYDVSDTQAGSIAANQLTLAASDLETKEESFLLIGGAFYKVDAIDASRVATISLATTGGLMPPATGTYVRPIVTGGRMGPFMELDTSWGANGDWSAALLDRFPLIFPDETPQRQRGKAFSTAFGRPVVVVLGAAFQQPVNVPAEFVLDPALSGWHRRLGDTSTNPELSWEYWNGKGWWKLNVTLDETLNLKTTGRVQFDVPSDIASSDWSGKTNYWIRARLIGGDYGREKVTVHTQPDSAGTGTIQTVKRSSEGIRAPSVVKLHVSYGVCKGIRPNFVQAEDSGTIRDQSDANRTAGAIVEAFVPLALTLGRLTKKAASTDATLPACPPDCNCKTLPLGRAEATPVATKAGATEPPRVSGREVYLGLAATPSESPVNVLLLVKENNHTKFAPMTIEALNADHFVPIVTDDKTRALGESGLLSMAFAVPPTPSELFGKTLTWLRLKPKPSPDGKWLPTLRGAYLNAVWASATETLTRELLGSSNGEPHLTVRLARPPVLYKTLELRVKEPLGQEEREALLKNDKNSVLSVVEGLPGDWVLWKQVVDPDDEPATARVYSLDENSGEIRFGDGIHGKIPPIGRDAIVAFRYSRTEPDPTGGDKVPANTITARAALNLVSPVESVETVTAADQAAGGAPPESADRVLRFGFARLRHRDRAVTTSDIEDLALQSSPDIVQAHAFVRRGYVRLVVVMRGKSPQPNAAQIRELRRLLLAAAPVSLSAPGALRIEGPVIRRLRIDLELQVETLDHAGALTDFVKQQLATFFDPATGGTDKDGWALGLNPNEGDIALALIDAPHLESIKDVKLRDITDDGRVLPSLEALKGNELVVLDDDPVRIQFETAEVMV